MSVATATREMPPDVAAAFRALPAALHGRLFELRRLIFEVAASDPRIGPVTETLKWGEPAYVAAATRSGSTVRLGRSRAASDRAAVFFTCSTRLVDGFRADFPELRTEGSRAVLVPPAGPLPAALALCIGRALTYRIAPRP